ncbi:GIY-YIG nuclease family protein [Micavibrio aeruginosavorus]|uniref:GIY-YIG catalytic domain protein n=1 Tax=Micavibrio aeruginosavorus (strain ARL-13) TaxID=856793 RepID=G2KM32_MICAA|nr:GIY-YIG nuclease family protein [Micavibrio aeruginosavorus]AEP09728.1 GIY-YIG catalytic domain protein [Micavibrio aeruginosavorus ARL-13]
MDPGPRRGDGGMMEKKFWVYMLASKEYGTLYIGVTSDLKKRIWEHKSKVAEGFTEKYDVQNLVWFEEHQNAESAITREKQMKEWKREWKLNRIKDMNPEWRDLYEDICK